MSRGGGICSCLELGCNIGYNLFALKALLPGVKLTGIEINEKAAAECKKIVSQCEVINASILEFESEEKYDLTFTMGVLIHIAPEFLGDVYDKLYQWSKRYILIGEYYNPSPVQVRYRENKDRLYKRDFAGELMDKYRDLHLVDYGFIYHRDYNFPGDDIAWFLLEKR